jgi:hypothetical protein
VKSIESKVDQGISEAIALMAPPITVVTADALARYLPKADEPPTTKLTGHGFGAFDE